MTRGVRAEPSVERLVAVPDLGDDRLRKDEPVERRALDARVLERVHLVQHDL